jgi:hypothetical protein
MIQVLIKKKGGLLFIPVIIGRQRFEHAMKTLRSQYERRENVVESLRTRYNRPQIASSGSVNAVQSQHDRRTNANGFFFIKTWRFGRRSRHVLQKRENAVGTQRIAVSVTGALQSGN